MKLVITFHDGSCGTEQHISGVHGISKAVGQVHFAPT